MASLTNPVNQQNIVDRFADYVKGNADWYSVWGTDALPFPECDFTWIFGGGQDKGLEINGGSIGTNGAGEITAQNIYDTLIAETARFTRVRTMRCTLFVNGAGGNNGSRPTAGTVYDQTNIAHLNSNYQQGIGAAGRDNVWAGNVVTAGGLEVMFSNMRALWDGVRGNSVGTLTTTVCHASCHSSCHSSRGRR